MTAAKHTPVITTYGLSLTGDTYGQKSSSFDAPGCRVLITPTGDTTTEDARRFAALLAGHSEEIEAQQADAQVATRSLLAEIARLKAALASAQAMIPPSRPASMFGRGFVRFSSAGELWALGRRERGFGEFGFRFDGWDDLFRRLDVVVVESGRDEHGDWWAIENRAAIAKAKGGAK